MVEELTAKLKSSGTKGWLIRSQQFLFLIYSVEADFSHNEALLIVLLQQFQQGLTLTLIGSLGK